MNIDRTNTVFEVLLRYLQYALQVLQVLWWRSFDRFMTRFLNWEDSKFYYITYSMR